MANGMAEDPRQSIEPVFGPAFRARLEELFRWRRDVRHFREDPVPDTIIEDLLAVADLAPSVGLSQPWRFVDVKSDTARKAVVENYGTANADALTGYANERATLYAGLKLAGLKEAPVQFAVFVEPDPEQGHGLGRKTMPLTVHYSAVMAVHNLWLAARARGLGLGWVSILDPDRLCADLDVPENWDFIAYLCIGWPREAQEEPELSRVGWESRRASAQPLRR